jgi:hypothetical protein
MKDIFTREAVDIDPRLKNADFDFDIIMDSSDDYAFLSGSVVEGFGNASSDVDIFVVSDKIKEYQTGKKICFINSEGGYYNEIQLYTHRWHNDVGSKLNALEGRTYSDYRAVAYDELSYYYRVAIGVPAINPENFISSSGEYKKAVINKHISNYFGYEAYGQIYRANRLHDDGETGHAYHYACKAAADAVDSVLAAHGEGYMSNKFRFSKIERAFGKKSDIYRAALDLRYLGGYGVDEYILRVNDFLRDLGIFKYEHDVELRYRLTGEYAVVDFLQPYIISSDYKTYQISEDCLHVIDMIKNGVDNKDALLEKLSEKYGASEAKARLAVILDRLQRKNLLAAR